MYSGLNRKLRSNFRRKLRSNLVVFAETWAYAVTTDLTTDLTDLTDLTSDLTDLTD